MPIIKNIKGDLLGMAKTGVFDAIAHGCNCQNTFGSGIALQIAKVFPEAAKADKRTKKGNRDKLGGFSSGHHFYERENEEDIENPITDVLTIYNLYTQFEYGRDKVYLDYEALENCFLLLNSRYVGDDHKPTIGIPKIGCGQAGGDWNRTQEIINRVTPDLDLIYVEYVPIKKIIHEII